MHLTLNHKLQSENLELIPITDRDLELVYRALSDPDVYKYYGVRFLTREEALEQMKWYRSHLDNQTGIWWKIIRKSDRMELGACGFNDWNHESADAEAGCWLLPEFWGKGYMSESFQIMLNFGFKGMGLQQIYAFADQGNSNSKKLLKRMGFEFFESKLTDEIKNGSPVVEERFLLRKKD